jgi:hypothetical protein
MPLPWTTILTHVPWRDVIANAPKIADGAKKLWKGMNARSDGSDDTAAELSGEALAEATVDTAARLDVLEASNRKLRTQMLASSELIQALSEQNSQLVAQIETNRRHTRQLGWALLATAAVAIAALALALPPRLLEFFA